jgi:hypothetical protein
MVARLPRIRPAPVLARAGSDALRALPTLVEAAIARPTKPRMVNFDQPPPMAYGLLFNARNTIR